MNYKNNILLEILKLWLWVIFLNVFYSDLEALQRECKDGTFGYRCLFTCRCYRNRVCDKKTGRCPRDECANGFWGEGCQLGVYQVRCNTKVIQLFLMSRISYKGGLFWSVSLSFLFGHIVWTRPNEKKQHVLFKKDQGPRLV